ncbi:hypothetical protein B0H11DRAFT_2202300 [Mycena galericulata]|nr:hypothetical protein B0H11DRAFT_2202300 [Mycena galericulata]
MHVLAFAAVANLGATVFPDLIAGIRKHTSFEGVVFWTDIKATDLGLEQGQKLLVDSQEYTLSQQSVQPHDTLCRPRRAQSVMRLYRLLRKSVFLGINQKLLPTGFLAGTECHEVVQTAEKECILGNQPEAFAYLRLVLRLENTPLFQAQISGCIHIELDFYQDLLPCNHKPLMSVQKTTPSKDVCFRIPAMRSGKTVAPSGSMYMYQLGSSNLVPRKSRSAAGDLDIRHPYSIEISTPISASHREGVHCRLIPISEWKKQEIEGDAFTTGELIFTTLHPVSQSTAPTSQARNVWLWRCKLQRTFLKLRQATIHPSTTTRWAARQLLPGEITAMNELFLTMAGCRMEPASLKVRSLC